MAGLAIIPGLLDAQEAWIWEAPEIVGEVRGSIRQMTRREVRLESGASITGGLLVPGDPTVLLRRGAWLGQRSQGRGAAGGTDFRVVLEPGARLAELRTRTDPVDWPNAEEALAELRVSADGGSRRWLAGSLGPESIQRSRYLLPGSILRLEPGNYDSVVVPPNGRLQLGSSGDAGVSTYQFGSLDLKRGAAVEVESPVVATLQGNLTLNGGGAGDPGHPGWLELRLMGGDLKLLAGARIFGRVRAPAGAVVIGEGASLTGGLLSRWLKIQRRGRLDVVLPPESNHLPVVRIAEVDSGEPRIAPARLPIEVQTRDPDGRVVLAVVRVDGVEIDRVMDVGGLPATLAMEPVLADPGLHAVTIRVRDDRGGEAESDPLIVAVDATLPTLARFEEAEGFQAGPWRDALGWQLTGEFGAVIVGEAADGAQYVELGSGTNLLLPWNYREAPPEVTFADFFVWPGGGTREGEGQGVDFDGARVRLRLAADGGIPLLEVGNAEGWHGLTDESGSADWTRISLRRSAGDGTWDLWRDGRLRAHDLPLGATVPGAPPGFLRVEGSAGEALGFDSFYAGRENPLYPDADADGLDDEWEFLTGGSPEQDDRDCDADADGLVTIEEFMRGTRPDEADTDGDGLPDGWEVQFAFNPLEADPLGADRDGDGLTDQEEYGLGTHPVRRDTDGDGLPDLWEAEHGLDPGFAGDALADADGDGLTSFAEYEAGTDPNDFFNGVAPEVAPLEGVPANQLVLRVGHPDGTPWLGAPVTFEITAGDRGIASTAIGPFGFQAVARADAEGIARAFLEDLAP